MHAVFEVVYQSIILWSIYVDLDQSFVSNLLAKLSCRLDYSGQ